MRVIDIMSEVEHLDKEEQLNLLKKLVAVIRKKQGAHDLKLSAISGVGSDIWQGKDIDKYIETGREW